VLETINDVVMLYNILVELFKSTRFTQINYDNLMGNGAAYAVIGYSGGMFLVQVLNREQDF